MTWGNRGPLQSFKADAASPTHPPAYQKQLVIAISTMVLPKSKKSVGLGNSLMNDRFGKGKGADMRRGNFTGGIERTGQNGERVSYAWQFHEAER